MNPFPIANEILHQVLAFSSRGNLYELAKVNQNFSSMISKCFSHSPYQIIVYMEFVNGECFIGASIGSSVRVVRGAELQQLLEIVKYQKYLRVGHTSIALTASLALADTQIFEPICHVWSGKTLECTFSNPSTYSHGVQDSLTSLARLTHEFVPGYIFLKLMLTETEYEDLTFNTPVLPVSRLADWLCESRNELKLRKLELFTAKCNQKELKETVELLKEKFLDSKKPNAFEFIWVTYDHTIVDLERVQNLNTSEEFKISVQYINGCYRHVIARSTLEASTK